MLIKAGVELKEDIEFLRQTLRKIESENLHDIMEGKRMLRDQISHMQERMSEIVNKSGG